MHDFLLGHLMHMLAFHPYIYKGLTSSVAYPQSLSPVVISLPLCSCELARIREPWRKNIRGLWSHLSSMVVGVVCSNTISVETS